MPVCHTKLKIAIENEFIRNENVLRLFRQLLNFSYLFFYCGFTWNRTLLAWNRTLPLVLNNIRAQFMIDLFNECQFNDALVLIALRPTTLFPFSRNSVALWNRHTHVKDIAHIAGKQIMILIHKFERKCEWLVNVYIAMTNWMYSISRATWLQHIKYQQKNEFEHEHNGTARSFHVLLVANILFEDENLWSDCLSSAFIFIRSFSFFF